MTARNGPNNEVFDGCRLGRQIYNSNKGRKFENKFDVLTFLISREKRETLNNIFGFNT